MKPILFNTEMVRAILDGRKTVTRRVIDVPQGFKFLGWNMDSGDHIQYGECTFISDNGITQIIRKPKYKINDVLYIRETFMEHYTYSFPIAYLILISYTKQISVIMKD